MKLRRVAAPVAMGVVCVALIGLARSCGWNDRARVAHAPTTEASGRAGPGVWTESEGRQRLVIDYLHEQSSLIGGRMVRPSRPAAGPAPGSCLELGGVPRLVLPPVGTEVGASLDEALRRAMPAGSSMPAAAHEVGSDDDPAAESVSLERLGELLHYSAGVTSDAAQDAAVPLRAAPSAGALYPTDLYVAARRVAGVDPGVYYYHPRDHALLRVGDARAMASISDAVARPEVVRDAAVLFVLAASFDRTIGKYGARAYRYIAMDAGHIAANLRLVAAATGVRCVLEPRFDDAKLARLLGTGPAVGGALLVVACPATPASPGALTASVPAHEVLDSPPDFETQELTRLAHQLTSWRLLDRHAQPVPPSGPWPTPAGITMDLAAPSPARHDLFGVIAARRSRRDFAPGPVTAEDFAGVLRDTAALAPMLRHESAVELFAVVRAVEELPAGLYRYLPDRHALEPLRQGSVASRLERAGLGQPLLGRAAFVLVWAFRGAPSADGARGYRHAALEIGISGEHAYLSAESRQLGICAVGAFDDEAVTELVDGGRRGVRVLHLAAIGQRN